ncbi:hypothetical protein HPB49_019782 [Dermacentor silvarum]|uniref:Uncharacterized protein n=1 Tax=Dermacentor silvarum TaxID=543639 RepID=A0ACB8E2R6_DERSI|nr:hypothetical protein HPB49_019782 [Dermacentor silvarum]
MSDVEAIKNDQSRYLKEFKRLWETTKVFLDDKYLPEPEVGLEIYGKMIINSYCICNDEHSPVGTGLYIGPSILDHSCSPNAHAVYEGHKLQLRAAQDIKCSNFDGIRVSYIDVMAPKNVRQQELKSQYYFECSCTKCSDKVPDYVVEKSPALTASVKKKMKEVEEQAMQHTTTLLQLRQWAEDLLETEQLAEADYARIHVLDLLSKCCLGLEDYQAALPPYLAREPIYRQSYGLYSPVYGVLLYSIAKLYHITVQLKKAMEYFEKDCQESASCAERDVQLVSTWFRSMQGTPWRFELTGNAQRSSEDSVPRTGSISAIFKVADSGVAIAAYG